MEKILFAMYYNFSSDIEGKHGKPKSLQLDGSKKRDSSGSCSAGTDNDLPDLPLSPTNYPQPPTPDCPPPSPSTAMHGIHLKINPQVLMLFTTAAYCFCP